MTLNAFIRELHRAVAKDPALGKMPVAVPDAPVGTFEHVNVDEVRFVNMRPGLPQQPNEVHLTLWSEPRC